MKHVINMFFAFVTIFVLLFPIIIIVGSVALAFVIIAISSITFRVVESGFGKRIQYAFDYWIG